MGDYISEGEVLMEEAMLAELDADLSRDMKVVERNETRRQDTKGWLEIQEVAKDINWHVDHRQIEEALESIKILRRLLKRR